MGFGLMQSCYLEQPNIAPGDRNGSRAAPGYARQSFLKLRRCVLPGVWQSGTCLPGAHPGMGTSWKWCAAPTWRGGYCMEGSYCMGA